MAPDTRSLRELNDRIEDGNTDVHVFDGDYTYPSIDIDSNKIIKPSIAAENAADVFVDRPISVWKRAWYTCRSKGILEGARVLADHNFARENYATIAFKKTLLFTLSAIAFIIKIYSYYFPYDLLSKNELCQIFSRCQDWKDSSIRAFAWHPNFYRCALALCNDDVYVYGNNNEPPTLIRHPLQRKIIDMIWHPRNKDQLAIGCQSVVLIWNVDIKQAHMSRVPLANARIIEKGLPSPLTTIAYDQSGEWLAVAGPINWKIVLIHENPEQELLLIKNWFSGISKLTWSPDGVRLLTHPTSSMIRIYENKAWSSATWTNQQMNSYCATSCYSQPNGRFLLMVPERSSTIYAVTFIDKAEANVVGGTTSLNKVLDLCMLDPPENEPDFEMGDVHEMQWDRHAERLVISFKESRYIAVLKTRTRPTLEITQLGWLHGYSNEHPMLMAFHDHFQRGSLLTVCWSTGFVSHIPFQYQPNLKPVISVTSCSTPRSLTNFASPSMLGSPISSPINRSRISSPKDFSFLASDSVITPSKPRLFSPLIGGND